MGMDKKMNDVNVVKEYFGQAKGPSWVSLSIEGHPIGRPGDLYWIFKSARFSKDGHFEIIFETDTLGRDDIIFRCQLSDSVRVHGHSLVIETSSGEIDRPGLYRKWSMPATAIFE